MIKPMLVTAAMKAKLFVVAVGLASGKSPTDAMRKAGYKVATPESARIRYLGEDGKRHHVPPAEHPVVAEFLAELQAEVRRQVPVTVGDIVDRLEEAYLLAKDKEQPATMATAAVSMAKVLGLIVDRKQLSLVKPIEQMTEEECVAVLGEEAAKTDGPGSSAVH